MATGRLKAGVAELELSGAPGTRLIGDLGPRSSVRTATPLMAKALVLSNGDETLALITLDLFGLPDAAATRLVEAIGRDTGLRPEAVMVICSHTREAPHSV